MEGILDFICKYMNYLIMCIVEPVDDQIIENKNIDINVLSNKILIPINSNNIEFINSNNIDISLDRLDDTTKPVYRSDNIDIPKINANYSKSINESIEISENTFENMFENNFKHNDDNLSDNENKIKYSMSLEEDNIINDEDSNITDESMIYSNNETRRLSTIKSENDMEDLISDSGSNKDSKLNNNHLRSYHSDVVKQALKRFEKDYESDNKSSKYLDSDSDIYYSSDYLSNDEIVSKYLEKKKNYEVSESDITCSETESKNTNSRIHKKILNSYNLNDNNSSINNYQAKHRKQLQKFIKDLNNNI